MTKCDATAGQSCMHMLFPGYCPRRARNESNADQPSWAKLVLRRSAAYPRPRQPPAGLGREPCRKRKESTATRLPCKVMNARPFSSGAITLPVLVIPSMHAYMPPAQDRKSHKPGRQNRKNFVRHEQVDARDEKPIAALPADARTGAHGVAAIFRVSHIATRTRSRRHAHVPRDDRQESRNRSGTPLRLHLYPAPQRGEPCRIRQFRIRQASGHPCGHH